MKVRIEFAPEDWPTGQTQILWADMSQREFDAVQQRIASPQAADIILTIPARIDGKRETHKRLFKASLIKVSKA